MSHTHTHRHPLKDSYGKAVQPSKMRSFPGKITPNRPQKQNQTGAVFVAARSDGRCLCGRSNGRPARLFVAPYLSMPCQRLRDCGHVKSPQYYLEVRQPGPHKSKPQESRHPHHSLSPQSHINITSLSTAGGWLNSLIRTRRTVSIINPRWKIPTCAC
ncbi:uncharacterized protein YALI1_E27610g [Yarrowia lipolytica]|uniref:Uncharacterized protein n=1 Tax=Yarrowia lipolytica TaxID=4952 RepID=A0A1D8NJM3_YARLL|nr:hypothetical protein YALI1_E27610g [Yarrowia lipolytica]